MRYPLCHCLNVYPGTSLEDRVRVLESRIPSLRALTTNADDRDSFAVGVWFDANSISTLIRQRQMRDFAAFFRGLGLSAFTANAFPFGTFHGTRVKTSVYTPDWTTSDRVEYTCGVADLLVRLLPDDHTEGSISTLPCGYKAHFDPAGLPRAAEQIRAVLRHLRRLRDDTGRTLRLAVEMEPDCVWESPAEFAAFYDRYFRQDELSEFLGVCYDTCHQELLETPPGQGLEFLLQQGICVPKIQLSAALFASGGPDSKAGLAEFFQDPVHLHQTRCGTGPGAIRYPDLPDALESADRSREWIAHFHIPVFSGAMTDGLRAADFELLAVLDRLREKPIQNVGLEIETYSYHALPGFAKSETLEHSMSRETAFVKERLGENRV